MRNMVSICVLKFLFSRAQLLISHRFFFPMPSIPSHFFFFSPISNFHLPIQIMPSSGAVPGDSRYSRRLFLHRRSEAATNRYLRFEHGIAQRRRQTSRCRRFLSKRRRRERPFRSESGRSQQHYGKNIAHCIPGR